MDDSTIKSYVPVAIIGRRKCLSSQVSRALVVVVLLLSVYGLAEYAGAPANAQVTFNFNLSLSSYSISIAPTHSDYIQVTVSLVSGSPRPVNLTSAITPQDGQLSTSFAQSSGTPTIATTLTITANAAPAGKQYAVSISGTSQGETRQAPVLTVTISCAQGPCPQPRLDSADKTTYVQGQSIQFSGSDFIPGDSTASCLTNNVSPVICQNQANADQQGSVSGSMQVPPTVSPGAQYFYLKDMTNDQQTQALQLTILSSSASEPFTTAVFGNGTVIPSCPSGCSEPIGQVLSITATAEPGWTFSQWSITGTTCSNGANTNPCTFTMPNNAVSVTANFVQWQGQYQTLYTGYSGYGSVTPSCPSGCPVTVGSPVSILATPASGWTLSGYQVTVGVSCSSQGGYTCSFPMPNFPVTFTASFTAKTTETTTTITVTSAIQTSATSPTTIVSLTTVTTTESTISATQAGSTVTTTSYSTSTSATTQAQLSYVTQFSTLTTTVAAIATTVQNPTLELALAAIILLSALTIGVGVVRGSPRHGSVACANCGFKNPAQLKYCVSCGEPLGGASKP